MIDDIETPRLLLRHMNSEFFQACLDGDIPRAEALLGLRITREWLVEHALMRVGLENFATVPHYPPWALRAIGWRESGEMAGYIGFHTPPDPEYLQTVCDRGIELAYVVFPRWRRKHVATEALIGLVEWAVDTGQVAAFAASIEEVNIPSRLLVERLGFLQLAMIDRENDGHLMLLYILDGWNLRTLLGRAQNHGKSITGEEES